MADHQRDPAIERIKVALLNPSAVLPRRGTPGAAGLDLTSVECAIVLPGHRKLISTGIAVRVPDGTYGRIAPRSGLALKSGVHVGAGVIDADYTGTVGVLLFNMDPTEPFEVRIGDRIAQLIVERISACEPEAVTLEEIKAENERARTGQRGDGGFGSTD
jgi:dUTP pyrophosphatase